MLARAGRGRYEAGMTPPALQFSEDQATAWDRLSGFLGEAGVDLAGGALGLAAAKSPAKLLNEVVRELLERLVELAHCSEVRRRFDTDHFISF